MAKNIIYTTFHFSSDSVGREGLPDKSARRARAGPCNNSEVTSLFIILKIIELETKTRIFHHVGAHKFALLEYTCTVLFARSSIQNPIMKIIAALERVPLNVLQLHELVKHILTFKSKKNEKDVLSRGQEYLQCSFVSPKR